MGRSRSAPTGPAPPARRPGTAPPPPPGLGADAAEVPDGGGKPVDAADPFVERVGHVEIAGVVELQRPGSGETGRRGGAAVAAVVVLRGVTGLPAAGHGGDDPVGVNLADPLVE